MYTIDYERQEGRNIVDLRICFLLVKIEYRKNNIGCFMEITMQQLPG